MLLDRLRWQPDLGLALSADGGEFVRGRVPTHEELLRQILPARENTGFLLQRHFYHLEQSAEMLRRISADRSAFLSEGSAESALTAWLAAHYPGETTGQLGGEFERSRREAFLAGFGARLLPSTEGTNQRELLVDMLAPLSSHLATFNLGEHPATQERLRDLIARVERAAACESGGAPAVEGDQTQRAAWLREQASLCEGGQRPAPEAEPSPLMAVARELATQIDPARHESWTLSMQEEDVAVEVRRADPGMHPCVCADSFAPAAPLPVSAERFVARLLESVRAATQMPLGEAP